MAKSRSSSRSSRPRGSIGRPKAEIPKDHVVAFRLTGAEHFELLDKAQRSGLTPNEYARSRTLRGIARPKKRAPDTAAVFGEATRQIFHEVRRQGVNLNQIAHHCNRHQVPPPHEVTALAGQLLELWQKLIGKP